jgi:hypothetical protein
MAGLQSRQPADVAQLVEHWLPKPRVAGSSPVVRFHGLTVKKTFVIAAVALGLAAAAAAVVIDLTSTTSPFDRAIAYTHTRAPFTPRRTIDVSTADQLRAAIAGLRAGDLVRATGDFTVQSSSGPALVIANRLSRPAVIDLSGHSVRFVYTGGRNVSAVWVENALDVRIYGGELSTSDTGGVCLSMTGSQHVTWWGFAAHDCGSTGLTMFTLQPGASGYGPVEYDDVQGEVWKMGQHPAWDPHTEKCSGLHGANLADNNQAQFAHNRIALYVHDSACAGSAIEFGASRRTPLPDENTIILRAQRLTYLSRVQTGGNCFQTWGYGIRHTTIEFLGCRDTTGHAYWAGGMFGAAGPDGLSTDIVEVGQASGTNQNPRYHSEPTWDRGGGTVFEDVRP